MERRNLNDNLYFRRSWKYMKSIGKHFSMKFGRTERGFALIRFFDWYGQGCAVQQSSLACVETLWIGISNEEDQCEERMLLERKQVEALRDTLTYWLDKGELPGSNAALKRHVK